MEKTRAKCEYCDNTAFKTNGNSELICENRANSGRCEGLKPYSKTENGFVKQRRNAPCLCGSGKKAKKCCIN